MSMATRFQKYKDAESVLQERISSLGYKVTIEPITGADMFYSDGSAKYSYGKACFTDNKNFEFNVFFPDYYCFISIPSSVKQELQKWVEELA
jgi:hypothetical protein